MTCTAETREAKDCVCSGKFRTRIKAVNDMCSTVSLEGWHTEGTLSAGTLTCSGMTVVLFCPSYFVFWWMRKLFPFVSTQHPPGKRCSSVKYILMAWNCKKIIEANVTHYPPEIYTNAVITQRQKLDFCSQTLLTGRAHSCRVNQERWRESAFQKHCNKHAQTFAPVTLPQMLEYSKSIYVVLGISQRWYVAGTEFLGCTLLS